MSRRSLALVHFQVRSLAEEKLLKDVLLRLKSFEWLDFSSLYRVNDIESATDSIHDLRSRVSTESLVGVGLGRTQLSPLECVQQIQTVEKSVGLQRGRPLVKVTLLLFDSQTFMLPVVTVPDPELHLKQFKLWPAAEVSPSWMHPVLGLDLRALADRVGRGQDWGSFVAQGKSVLDF